MRHAARRLSLSGTAPPFRGGKVTATPYAPVALLVADRPFSPPRSLLEFFGPDKPPDVGPPPCTPLPLAAPRAHPGPTRTYKIFFFLFPFSNFEAAVRSSGPVPATCDVALRAKSSRLTSSVRAARGGSR